jgi:hypothetical protein
MNETEIEIKKQQANEIEKQQSMNEIEIEITKQQANEIEKQQSMNEIEIEIKKQQDIEIKKQQEIDIKKKQRMNDNDIVIKKQQNIEIKKQKRLNENEIASQKQQEIEIANEIGYGSEEIANGLQRTNHETKTRTADIQDALATMNADINIEISHNDENEILQYCNNNEMEIKKQRKNEIEIKTQRMIENAVYKMKNVNRQDQSAATNKMKGQRAWQQTILPTRTICAISKLVLDINGTGTDNFLQLLFGDTPSHNWGVMSDTMYLVSQY